MDEEIYRVKPVGKKTSWNGIHVGEEENQRQEVEPGDSLVTESK